MIYIINGRKIMGQFNDLDKYEKNLKPDEEKIKEKNA